MRNAIKVVLVVSVIIFTLFLIQRSCHEGGPLHDPDQPGGMGGVALSRRQESLPQGITAQPYARTDKQLEEKRDFLAGIDSQKSARNDAANAPRLDEAARTEQVQGNWVLVDSHNTTLELTIVGNAGSLRSYRSESKKETGVEQKVRVVALDKSIFVVSDEEASKPSLIMLAFSFDAQGSADVTRLDSQRMVPLRVVSHTR